MGDRPKRNFASSDLTNVSGFATIFSPLHCMNAVVKWREINGALVRAGKQM